jgi:surface protein
VAEWCAGGDSQAAVTATYGNISSWDVSQVTDMDSLFQSQERCNPDISKWNTAAVTSMRSTFRGAKSFNANIGKWITAKVTDMSLMFYGALAFSQPIGNWNTAKVTDMSWMFLGAYAFDQPIGKWDTAKVTDMLAVLFLRHKTCAPTWTRRRGATLTCCCQLPCSDFERATGGIEEVQRGGTAWESPGRRKARYLVVSGETHLSTGVSFLRRADLQQSQKNSVLLIGYGPRSVASSKSSLMACLSLSCLARSATSAVMAAASARVAPSRRSARSWPVVSQREPRRTLCLRELEPLEPLSAQEPHEAARRRRLPERRARARQSG